ncbi:MAG TPA: NAD-dependent epimerase/dehydratase family protein [Flavihumibacter sp.]|jgi:dihydroflavonol-4-reductase
MEQILITGANGFLGNNLVRHFTAQGYKVRAMMRRAAVQAPGAVENLKSDCACEFFYGNIDNRDDLEKAVAGCDWVVHAAAMTDQWSTDPRVYEQINVKATILLAEVCVKARVKKMVYVSTANVFGPGTPDEPGTELNGFTLFKAESYYINTKYLAQQYLLQMAESGKLPVVLVNPCFMIGPHDYKPSSGTLLLHAFRKRVLFYPPGGKNFVFVGDVCKGIHSALEKGRVGQCYLLTGENLSYLEFFKRVKACGTDRCIYIRLPRTVLKFIAWIAPWGQKLFGRAWKFTRPIVYLSTVHAYYSGEKAERELDYTPRPIGQVVQETVDWFQTTELLRAGA